MSEIDQELYERKGPQWWSEHRGFCGHCGEPTNGPETCSPCKAGGHNVNILRDRGECGACHDQLGGRVVNKSELDKMLEDAKAATQLEWVQHKVDPSEVWCREYPIAHCDVGAGGGWRETRHVVADATHIANCSPKNIIWMGERLKELAEAARSLSDAVYAEAAARVVSQAGQRVDAAIKALEHQP